jgi:predicted amidohydrolase
MKIALLQLNSCDDPAVNLPETLRLIKEAAAKGADLILTPEVTNCVSASRSQQLAVLQTEEEDITLAAIRTEVEALGVWIAIGSLALKTDDPDGRFANRSFMINPTGDIAAWYDEIHMFDVDVSATETYRESDGYRPGMRAVLVDTPFGKIGLSICYDVRFPYLYRDLAQAGADIMLVPAAFSYVTGATHWETLLRSRAIETGSFVLAAAQTGTHAASKGMKRQTHGHSLVVAPWGEVIADAGKQPGITMVDLDLSEVSHARKRIAALQHDREYSGP